MAPAPLMNFQRNQVIFLAAVIAVLIFAALEFELGTAPADSSASQRSMYESGTGAREAPALRAPVHEPAAGQSSAKELRNDAVSAKQPGLRGVVLWPEDSDRVGDVRIRVQGRTGERLYEWTIPGRMTEFDLAIPETWDQDQAMLVVATAEAAGLRSFPMALGLYEAEEAQTPGLVLRLRPQAAIRGRVAWQADSEGTSPRVLLSALPSQRGVDQASPTARWDVGLLQAEHQFVSIDLDGLFEAPVRPGRVDVRVVGAGGVMGGVETVYVKAGTTHDCGVLSPPGVGARLVLRIQDDAARPIADAMVRFADLQLHVISGCGDDEIAHFRSAQDGRVELPLLAAELFPLRLAVADAFHVVQSHQLTFDSPSVTTITLRRRPARPIRLEQANGVDFPDGIPVSWNVTELAGLRADGGGVSASHRSGSPPIPSGTILTPAEMLDEVLAGPRVVSDRESGQLWVISEREGSFSLTARVAGGIRINATALLGSGAFDPIRIVAPPGRSLRIQLASALPDAFSKLSLRLRLTSARSSPGAALEDKITLERSGRVATIWVPWSIHYLEWTWLGVVGEAVGTTGSTELPPGSEPVIRVSPPTAISSPRITVQLTASGDSVSVQGVVVALDRVGDRLASAVRRTDAMGRAVFPVAAGSYRVTLMGGGSTPRSKAVDVSLGEEVVEMPLEE